MELVILIVKLIGLFLIFQPGYVILDNKLPNLTVIKAIICIFTILFISELLLAKYFAAVLDFIISVLWINIHRTVLKKKEI